MAELNVKQKKIVVKIVYYGPALSGKTTNLMQLHDLVNPESRGELMTLETKGDRTLFFDLLPMVVRSRGDFTIKIKLFTVPGQVAHDATRKAVLSRADGVVFVADSQNRQAMSNYESFDNLEKNAGRVGLNFDSLPLVIQFNKRDLADIIPEGEITRTWSPTSLPVRLASAIHGRGVRETFEEVLRRTYACLDRAYGLGARWSVAESDFTQTAGAPPMN